MKEHFTLQRGWGKAKQEDAAGEENPPKTKSETELNRSEAAELVWFVNGTKVFFYTTQWGKSGESLFVELPTNYY